MLITDAHITIQVVKAIPTYGRLSTAKVCESENNETLESLVETRSTQTKNEKLRLYVSESIRGLLRSIKTTCLNMRGFASLGDETSQSENAFSN